MTDDSDSAKSNQDGKEGVIGIQSRADEVLPESTKNPLPSGDENTKPPEMDPKKELWQRSRRSFLFGGLAGLTAYGGWRWILSRADSFGAPWPLRAGLEKTGGIMKALLGTSRLTPEFPPVRGQEARVNGDFGLAEPEFSTIQIKYGPEVEALTFLTIAVSEIYKLPRVDQTIEFKCIEGWSEVMSFAGARFSDFLEKYGLGRKADGTLYRFVGLETADQGYYVSVDIESMVHPQTLLSYEMNGIPLTVEHGAPLRLCIPVKYGIKNIKQIATIRFSDIRPPDFWHEEGYDWYASL